MPKNKAWNKLKYVERNIIQFQKIVKLSLVYNQHGTGNSGKKKKKKNSKKKKITRCKILCL